MGATVDFKMEKKGQFWNVTDITLAGQPTPDAPQSIQKPVKEEVTHNLPEGTERQSSIEVQNALTNATNLVIAGKAPKDLEQAVFNCLSSRLSGWFSQGKIEEQEETPMSTPEQRKLLASMAKEKGYSPDNAIAIMMRMYGVGDSKALTSDQADDFLLILKAGKYLDKNVAPF